ncbi:MAG: hypothetical protein LBI06_08790 [Treponema sp.]|nr:hypothetical protein [Treponema sp.]
MSDKKVNVIVNIAIKFIFLFALIIGSCLISKYANNNFQKAASVEIIGGSDGSTTLLVGSAFNLENILIYSLSTFLIIDILILIIFDIMYSRGIKTYNKKFKFKIILAMDLFMILALLIEIIFNLLGNWIALILNVILISTLFLMLYIKKNNGK